MLFELKKVPGKANAFAMGVTVGRIDTNDVVLDDASVSRFHAYFQKDARTGETLAMDFTDEPLSYVHGRAQRIGQRHQQLRGSAEPLGPASTRERRLQQLRRDQARDRRGDARHEDVERAGVR